MTTDRQPPNLERLAKHHLDQLSATHDEGEGGFLYRDDRQIRLLHISAHHGWDPDEPRFEPGVYVSARTRASAIHDMVAAGAISDVDELADVRDSVWDNLDHDLANATGLLRSDDPAERRMGAILRTHTLRQAQESLLLGNDRWLTQLLWSSAYRLLTGHASHRGDAPDVLRKRLVAADQAAFDQVRHLLLDGSPSGVALPPLPVAQGATAAFKRGLQIAINEYVTHHPILFPLLVPLRLTVFVVQPEQPRDLDNILLDLLPIVDQHMKPPQEPWLTSALDPAHAIEPDTPEGARRARAIRRIRSVVEYGVWSCQVIEIARVVGDPADGILTAVLGHGETRRSAWEQATDLLQRLDDD